MIPAITRRGLLKFAGGLAAGAIASPLPWTLLDDLAIWTQNRDAIPRLPRGPVTTRFTICSLCPAACGVRLRCVGGRPFAVLGAPAHPTSRGRLCPFGFAAHQLPWHPSRLARPVCRAADGTERAASAAEAAAAIATATREAPGALAIVDARPGRAISAHYRRLTAALGGRYLRAVPAEEAVPAALARMSTPPCDPPGWDLERTRLVLSFGAPVLESWGGPGRILARRAEGDGGGDLKIIQIESRPSRTALLADLWVAPRPGTEITAAFGVAHLLARGGCDDDFGALVAPFTPGRVAAITGIPAEVLESVAREFAGTNAAIAVIGDDLLAGPEGIAAATLVAALNMMIGSVGVAGGLLPRWRLSGAGVDDAAGHDGAFDDAGAAADGGLGGVESLPAGSLHALILDGEPGPALAAAIERALAPGAVVVSLSPYRVGLATAAQFIVPQPAWLETIEDMPTPPGSARALYGVTARLLEPPAGAVDPAAFVAAAARATGLGGAWAATTEVLVVAWVRALAASGRGRVVLLADGSAAAPATGDGLMAQLLEGAVWEDDPAPAVAPPSRSIPRPQLEALGRLAQTALEPAGGSEVIAASFPLVLVPYRDPMIQGRVLPTLASKLYRETDLRPAAGCALANPATAAAAGLRAGARIVIETPRGPIPARLRLDRAVLPGVVHFATGPAAGQLGEGPVVEAAGAPPAWPAAGVAPRPVRARLRADAKGGRRT